MVSSIRYSRHSTSSTGSSAVLHGRDGARGGLVPRGEPEPDRTGCPARPRRQPLSLHRLSQHRPGRSRRGIESGRAHDDRRRGHRRRRYPAAAPGGRRTAHRRSPLRRRSRDSRSAPPQGPAQPGRPRADRLGRHQRGPGRCPGSSPSSAGPISLSEWANPLPLAWPVTEDMPESSAPPTAPDEVAASEFFAGFLEPNTATTSRASSPGGRWPPRS